MSKQILNIVFPPPTPPPSSVGFSPDSGLKTGQVTSLTFSIHLCRLWTLKGASARLKGARLAKKKTNKDKNSGLCLIKTKKIFDP